MADDGKDRNRFADSSEAPTAETSGGIRIVSERGPAPPMPKQIGRYHLKDVIATGGMGTVYLAVQEHPRRTVALKLMRKGIASRSSLRRFEFESQILGRLKHPYIAQVYEAGTYDDGTGGVPYFAMEYVPNAKPITEYARDKELKKRQRLALFAMVCEAVHHGHQKGIVHRDLKPDNILIDSGGRPKIIDFGVARATDSDLAVTTLQTDLGQLVGTLQYMSPEQCAGDPHDVDTRSDVYSIGIVLYELLCGRRPYDVQRMAITEAARVITEEHPDRPSTIDRTLRGDVETITLKAMAKDRDLRYRSAIDLSDDIHRYLDNQPIAARPPSAAYRLSRFVARNKAVVVGVVAVFVALLAGIIATSQALIRAVDAEGVAEQRLVEAQEQRDRAVRAETLATSEADKARTEAARSQQIASFMRGMLSGVDPAVAQGKDTQLLKQILNDTSRRIDREFSDQPEIEADIRKTIGDTYEALGEYAMAEPHL